MPFGNVSKNAQTFSQCARFGCSFEQTTTRTSILDVTNFNSRAPFALQILRLCFANARVDFFAEFHLNPLEIISIIASRVRASPLTIGQVWVSAQVQISNVTATFTHDVA
jgi:hypothetical protein